MIEDLMQDFRLLQKADSLIARFWLRLAARRFALASFAGLVAMFGLGMANLAGFRALESVLGPVWAPAVVALVDLALAALVWLLAAGAKPDPAIELAFDVRQMAVEAVEKDARGLRAAVDALGSQMRGIKDSVAGLVHDPFESAAQQFLVPAALSLLRSLRGKKPTAS